MNWLKQNPFLAFFAAAVLAIIVGGGAYVSSEAARLEEQQAAFEQKSAQLLQLEQGKPFPNQANVDEAKREEKDARAEFDALAKGLAVAEPSATPQDFNDELAKLVKDVDERAAAKGVLLPDNFYLGFEVYEKQLPAPEVASKLMVQLRAIHAVVSAVVQSGAKSLGPVFRVPLEGETSSPQRPPPEKPSRGRNDVSSPIEISPFEVTFVADQSAFRLAFNKIVELEPPIFVRLVSLENSSASPLPKGETSGQSAATASSAQPAESAGAGTGGIRVVLGRETLTVNLRLASVVASEVAPAP